MLNELTGGTTVILPGPDPPKEPQSWHDLPDPDGPDGDHDDDGIPNWLDPDWEDPRLLQAIDQQALDNPNHVPPETPKPPELPDPEHVPPEPLGYQQALFCNPDGDDDGDGIPNLLDDDWACHDLYPPLKGPVPLQDLEPEGLGLHDGMPDCDGLMETFRFTIPRLTPPGAMPRPKIKAVFPPKEQKYEWTSNDSPNGTPDVDMMTATGGENTPLVIKTSAGNYNEVTAELTMCDLGSGGGFPVDALGTLADVNADLGSIFDTISEMLEAAV